MEEKQEKSLTFLSKKKIIAIKTTTSTEITHQKIFLFVMKHNAKGETHTAEE